MFLIAVIVGGDAIIARCRAVFQKARLAKDFQHALNSAQKLLHDADASKTSTSRQYAINDGALCTMEGRRLSKL